MVSGESETSKQYCNNSEILSTALIYSVSKVTAQTYLDSSLKLKYFEQIILNWKFKWPKSLNTIPSNWK